MGLWAGKLARVCDAGDLAGVGSSGDCAGWTGHLTRYSASSELCHYEAQGFVPDVVPTFLSLQTPLLSRGQPKSSRLQFLHCIVITY